MTPILRKSLRAFALLAVSSTALAGWSLDAEKSALNFVSIKNNAVTEVHSFGALSGGVADDGGATLNIALDSVETGIPIRNERMRAMLFQTDKFVAAKATLAVDLKVMNGLKAGQEKMLEQDVTLDLHGVTATLPSSLRVTRLDKKTWRVDSARPVVVNAASFDLVGGIEALREVAKLAAIGVGVPVTLSLTFRAE